MITVPVAGAQTTPTAQGTPAAPEKGGDGDVSFLALLQAALGFGLGTAPAATPPPAVVATAPEGGEVQATAVATTVESLVPTAAPAVAPEAQAAKPVATTPVAVAEPANPPPPVPKADVEQEPKTPPPEATPPDVEPVPIARTPAPLPEVPAQVNPPPTPPVVEPKAEVVPPQPPAERSPTLRVGNDPPPVRLESEPVMLRAEPAIPTRGVGLRSPEPMKPVERPEKVELPDAPPPADDLQLHAVRPQVDPTATTPTPIGRPTPEPAPPVHAQVHDHIVQTARLVEHDRPQRFVLELNPPDLGRLQVHLERTAEGLTAHLYAAEEGTRLLIEGQVEQLRQRLTESACPVVRCNVGDLGGQPQSRQQQSWRQPRQDAPRWRVPAAEAVRGGQTTSVAGLDVVA